MRTLHVDLSVPEGCAPEDAAKLRRVWAAHADRGREAGDWRIVFRDADADAEAGDADADADAEAGDADADAVLSMPVTSWVHWNALFAFIEAGGSGAGPDGLRVSSTFAKSEGPKPIPSLAYSLAGDGGEGGSVRLGFDEGDACGAWDVFAVRASPDISFNAALIHSAMYARKPGASLPELAGEALGFFDNPAALFEQ